MCWVGVCSFDWMGWVGVILLYGISLGCSIFFKKKLQDVSLVHKLHENCMHAAGTTSLLMVAQKKRHLF
jgi:hypothetical protein